MCVTVLCVPASGLVGGEWSFCVLSIFLRWISYAVALVKVCDKVLCAVALVMIFDWVVCFVVPWYL